MTNKTYQAEEYFRLEAHKMAIMKAFLPQGEMMDYCKFTIASRALRNIGAEKRPNFHYEIQSAWGEVTIIDNNEVSYYFNTQGGDYDIYSISNALQSSRDGWKNTKRRLKNMLQDMELGFITPDAGVDCEPRHPDCSLLRPIKGLRFEIITSSGVIRPQQWKSVEIASTPAKVCFWHDKQLSWNYLAKGSVNGYGYTIRKKLIEIEINEAGTYTTDFWIAILSDIVDDMEYAATYYDCFMNHMAKCRVAEPRVLGEEIKDNVEFAKAAIADYETHKNA